ncbi:MAG: hypothetical protein V1862_11055, partial [Methanobacteriota archaeon]
MTGNCPPPDLSYQDFSLICRNLKTMPGLVPITITFPVPDASPATLYKHLRTSQGFLLESMEGVPRRAVRSIIGTGITDIITLDEGKDTLTGPIEQLRAFLAERQLTGRVPAGFAGGLIGYCSYDMVSSLNHGYLNAGKAEHCPIGRFMITTSGVVLDHQAGSCTIFVTSTIKPEDDLFTVYSEAVSEVTTLASRVLQISPDAQEKSILKDESSEFVISSSMEQEIFEAAVR